MSDMAEVRQMFTTLMEEQATLRTDVKEINQRLTDIVKIEQEQLNQAVGMTRMGNHIDRLESEIRDQDKIITDLRIASAKLIVKVSLISGGSASGVFGAIWVFLQVSGKAAGA